MPNRLSLHGQAERFYQDTARGLRRELDWHLTLISEDPWPDEAGERVVEVSRPPAVLYVYTAGAWTITYTFHRIYGSLDYSIAVYGVKREQ